MPCHVTRFHLNDTDSRLFSLVVELRDKNPRQEGLTSKTVTLDKKWVNNELTTKMGADTSVEAGGTHQQNGPQKYNSPFAKHFAKSHQQDGNPG